MAQDLSQRKYKLMGEIQAIQGGEELAALEAYINQMKLKQGGKEILKPLRENISVEDLKKEQNYQPPSQAEFDAWVQKLNIEEPIEDLLAMLD